MANWDKQAVEAAIGDKGWYASERPIQGAIQFILVDGTKVNYYDTGTVHVQGKDTPIKREAEEVFAGPAAASRARATAAAPVSGPTATVAPAAADAAATAPNRVFIVYGHDSAARDQLELLLLRLKIEPIILQNIPGRGDTIIEKLEQLTPDADFACVLLTPDDEGRKRMADEQLQPRARQNVVLELGMVLSRLGRRRVAILMKDNGIERPSDISGLIYISFSESVNEAKLEIAQNLQDAGFDIRVGDLNA